MRRDDLWLNSDDEMRRNPGMEAHDVRARQAHLAREIAAGQTLSGSNTSSRQNSFRFGGREKVVSRDPFSGRLTIDWQQVSQEQDD